MRNDVICDPKDNNDLVVYQGDFYVAPADQQHIAHIVEADAGQYKQFPFLGVGIRRFVNGIVDQEVRRMIQKQVQADGYSAREVQYLNGVLSIKI